MKNTVSAAKSLASPANQKSQSGQSPRGKVSYIIVSENSASQRLDNFLIKHLKNVPKSRLYRIVRKGEVRINGKRCAISDRLAEGDKVRIPPIINDIPDALAPKHLSQSLSEILTASVLYEDEGLIVLNKPSGLAVHGGSGLALGVIEAMRLQRGEKVYLELVHRLDRDTSGCLLIAKKPAVLRSLHEQLREGTIKKVYTLLVQGKWPRTLKQVDLSLVKNRLHESGERRVNVHEEGQESLTYFNVVTRFEEATLMEARPHTGRTHQIRVHAAASGHPIAGDSKYGDTQFNKSMKAIGCNRLFLHASQLRFKALSGEWKEVSAPLPTLLEKCIAAMHKRVIHSKNA